MYMVKYPFLFSCYSCYHPESFTIDTNTSNVVDTSCTVNMHTHMMMNAESMDICTGKHTHIHAHRPHDEVWSLRRCWPVAARSILMFHSVTLLIREMTVNLDGAKQDPDELFSWLIQCHFKLLLLDQWSRAPTEWWKPCPQNGVHLKQYTAFWPTSPYKPLCGYL